MRFLHSSKPLPKSSDVALLEKSGSLGCFVSRDEGAVGNEPAASMHGKLVLFTAASEGAEQS